MIKARIHSSCPQDWDDVLEVAGREGTLIQSKYWADVLSQRDGAIPLFVRASVENKPLGQALYILKREQGGSGWSAVCNGGPVVVDGDAAEVIGAILSAYESGKPRGVQSTTVTMAPFSEHSLSNTISDIFCGVGYSSSTWGTFLVDLHQSEEALFKTLAHASRKCINKCKRNNVSVFWVNSYEEFVSVFWEVFHETKVQKGLVVPEPSPIPYELDVNKRYHYGVALSEDGEPLACLGMHLFNGVATEIASATAAKSYELKLPGQDVLHWEIMLRAKALGCHTFDLAGVNPNPQTSKEQGIMRFKKKWGGRYVEYPVYRKYYPSVLGRAKMALTELWMRAKGDLV